VKDRENKTPAAEETGRIRDLCREKGVLVGSGGTLGNVLRIQPPLVISVEELDQAIDTIDKALGEAVR